MIDPPNVVQTDSQKTAVIRLTVRRREVQAVMGPAINELLAAVSAQGAGPAGPVFSHHFRTDPEVFDFEVGVPVMTSITPDGRVQPGELRAAVVARTVYRGPYEGLGAAWGELCDWMTAHGQESAPDFWEYYVTGPQSSPDPATWQTELNRPLIEQAG